jgi:phage tail tape-measure protein
MNTKYAVRCTTAISLALVLSTAYAAGDAATSSAEPSSTNTQRSEPLTGKQKATAIGATSGAVAGAVVGGPVGAVVGAGIGGYVGHEGTDAHGHVSTSPTSNASDSTIRRAQAALNEQGYDVGPVDGRWGPNTESAVRRFQAKSGLAESGTLDSSTLSALGVRG